MINTAKSRNAKITTGLALVAAVFIIILNTPNNSASTGDKNSHAGRNYLNSLTGSYLAAVIAEKEGKLDIAARYYLASLKHKPNDNKLINLSILTLARTGNIDGAIKLADQSTNEVSPTIIVLRAVEKIKQNNFEAAYNLINQINSSEVGGIMAPVFKSWALAGQNRYDEASKILATTMEEGSITPLIHYHQGLMNELAGNLDKAEAEFQLSAEGGNFKAQRVIEVYGNLLERENKKSKAAQVYKAFTEQSNNNWFGHEAQRNAMLGLSSKNPSVTSAKDGVAELLFNLASMVYDSDDSTEAYVYINLSLYLKNDFPNATLMKGLFLESDGEYQQAIDTYRSISKDSIYKLRADYQVASSLSGLGQPAEAVNHLKSVAMTRPDLNDIHSQIGDILRSEEKYSEAATEYTKAIDNISEPEQWHWTLYYSRGVSFERAKAWDKAEADFHKALELNPDQPDVLNYLAYSWLEHGKDVEKAKINLEKAVAQRPNEAHILDSYGWALFKCGEYNKAVEQLETALELKPDDPFINDHLGDAYWKNGRKTEAMYQWQKALYFNPNNELAADIDSKIKNGLAGTKTANVQ